MDEAGITQDAFNEMQGSVLIFVRQMFDLTPQPLLPEYAARFDLGLKLRGKDWDAFCTTVRPFWFGPYLEGKHLTWQQALVLYGIDKSLRGHISNRISIVSGHGIGKSMIFAIVILWFLFVHPESQIGCTAPSADQMYDVLWKELKKWIERVKPPYNEFFVWESSHVRAKEMPAVWFARAKTSSKENTEALAGMHATWVMLGADEASGVEEPIFETMEGALTGEHTLILLAGNGIRSLGYFYDTHHKDQERWQTYSFSSLDSPRIPQKYVDDIIAKYGADSQQYAIRVEGKFPDEGSVDDKGYVQLFNEADLHIVPYDHDWRPIGQVKAALDPSGEGQDSSEWAVRDRARAAIVASETESTPSSLALKSMTIVEKYRVDPFDFTIDAFGTGHPVAQEIALATSKEVHPWRVNPINTGDQCPSDRDQELYINIRAMIYHKLMLWCRAGGELMDSPRLKDELLSIRFRRTAMGKIQIMDKLSMKKLGYPSPNKADALSMTFLRPDSTEPRSVNGVIPNSSGFDPSVTME